MGCCGAVRFCRPLLVLPHVSCRYLVIIINEIHSLFFTLPFSALRNRYIYVFSSKLSVYDLCACIIIFSVSIQSIYCCVEDHSRCKKVAKQKENPEE